MQITKTLRVLFGNRVSIFNDKLKDGTRSVKVWGWSYNAAKLAEQHLKEQGCAVTIVYTARGAYRLYIKP